MRAKGNAFRTFANDCPNGTIESSPAFQRWEAYSMETSPEGTAERAPGGTLSQPSLRDSNPTGFIPGVETPGYYRDVPPGQTFIEFPSGLPLNPISLIQLF